MMHTCINQQFIFYQKFKRLLVPTFLCKLNAGGIPTMDWYPIQGRVEILLVTPCYRNGDMLWPDGPLGSYANFTHLTF